MGNDKELVATDAIIWKIIGTKDLITLIKFTNFENPINNTSSARKS